MFLTGWTCSLGGGGGVIHLSVPVFFFNIFRFLGARQLCSSAPQRFSLTLMGLYATRPSAAGNTKLDYPPMAAKTDDLVAGLLNFIKVRKSVKIPCSSLVKLYNTASLLWVSRKHRTWKRRPRKHRPRIPWKRWKRCLCTNLINWGTSLFYEINCKKKI